MYVLTICFSHTVWHYSLFRSLWYDLHCFGVLIEDALEVYCVVCVYLIQELELHGAVRVLQILEHRHPAQR